jgi:DNA-binding transcriptional regulator GbsR (MarR family)
MDQLDSVTRRFVLHWGEMGTRWGINRTVAQVHALLYLSARPMNADEIVEALEVSRSNVSMSLKDLLGWGLVRTVHLPGDRRDHLETLHDPWELFRIVFEERRKREFDPTHREIQSCLDEAERLQAPEHIRSRLAAMRDFFSAAGAFHDTLRAIPVSAWPKLGKAGAALRRLLG